MKLLRVGKLGSEIVAGLDSNNIIRDLSDHIKDLNPQTINEETFNKLKSCLLYTSPSPRDVEESRMPSSA